MCKACVVKGVLSSPAPCPYSGRPAAWAGPRATVTQAVFPLGLLIPGKKQTACLGVRASWALSKPRMVQSNTDPRKGCLASVPLSLLGASLTMAWTSLCSWGSSDTTAVNESKQLPAFHTAAKGFLGLSWTIPFWTPCFEHLILLVNQQTKTLQSRAAFIRLHLLVSNNLFHACLITLSKNSGPVCPVGKGHDSPHLMALPNPGDFNAVEEQSH